MPLRKFEQQGYLRYLWSFVWILFVVGVACIVGYYSYTDRLATLKQPLRVTQRSQIDTASVLINRKVSEIETVMRLFKHELELLKPEKSTITQAFRTLFNVYPELLQVRWLDLSGNEKVRLEITPDGSLRSVEDSALQNKASRYYFASGLQLEQREIFITPIDLNVENGIVQRPFYPTVRAVTKAHQAELGDGLLVINFDLRPLLENLKALNTTDNFLLVGAGTAKWILHPVAEREWSVDLSTTPANIVVEVPELWHQLSAHDSVTTQTMGNHIVTAQRIESPHQDAGGMQEIYLLTKSHDSLLPSLQTSAVKHALLSALILCFFGLIVLLLYVNHFQRLKRLSKELKDERDSLKTALDQQTVLITELAESQKLSSLSVMVAGLAHELNTPVGATNMALSNLQALLESLTKQASEGLTKEQFNHYINQSSKAITLADANNQRAIGLVKSFKRLSFERAKDDFSTFNVLQTVSDLKRTMAGLFKESHVTVNIQIPASLELQGYAGAFSQIIQILFSNAMEHAFNGRQGNEITLEANSFTDKTEVIVKDNGVGISESMQTKAFDPFITSKRHQQHTGLGLHMAKAWMFQAFEGDIRITQSSNDGTEFTLTFPKIPNQASNEGKAR